MARKFSAFTNNPSRVPTDTLVGLDISAAANAQNSYWSLNTLFSEITGNITDGAVRFGGFAAPAVSAAGKAAFYFDSTSNTLKLSENAGAYADVRSGTVTVPQGGTGRTTLTAYALLAGGTTTTGNVQSLAGVGTSGQVLTSNGAGALPTFQTAVGTIGGSIANTQIAVGSGANTIAGSASLTFASGVVSISSTSATCGVAATNTVAGETGFTANQAVSGAASYAFSFLLTPSTSALLALTTAGYTPANLVKADQLRLTGGVGTVEILTELLDAGRRFAWGMNNIEIQSLDTTNGLTIGAPSSAATPMTGSVRLYNASGTTTTKISAGNAASSLNFILPVVNPTAGQVLSASAPSGANVTLSWVAASSVTSLTATQIGFGDGTDMLSGSADFTYDSTNHRADISANQNSSAFWRVTNSSSGNAAQSRFGASADVSGVAIAAYSSTFTTAGLITANTALLDMDAPNAVIAAQTAGALIFGMGTTTERARLTDTTFLLSVDPTTGSGLNVASATVSSGNLARIAMTGTAAASNTKTALSVTSSGANGTASQTVTGASFSVTNTGTTNTNVALSLTASGAATANTALNVTAGAIVQASNLAAAFVSGPNGATNPVFQLVNNVASAATGLSVTGNAAGSGVTLTALSSGSNESIVLTPKGSGTLQAFGSSTWRVDSSGNVFQGGSVVMSAGNVTMTNTSSTILWGAPNAGLANSSSGIVRVTDGSTGTGGLLIGTSANTGLAGALTISASILRGGAATFSLGAADAAAPVAQTLSVQNVVAGTTDTAGANWTFAGSRGTGTGNGGAILFQTAPAGSTGSSQNALATALSITSAANVGVGTSSFVAGSARVLAVASGTAPSTGLGDAIQLYSQDSAAANAEAFIRNENAAIARLTGTVAYVTSQFDVASSTALATVTGSTVQVEAGVTYNFRANVFMDAGASGGIKLSIGGTATATAVIFQTSAVINSTTAFVYCTRQTALDGTTTAVGATGYWGQIWGTITVNAAGTLGLRFAQAVSDGTNSSVLVGSTFQIWQS